MANMNEEVYKSKQALPNKALNTDGTITDLLGNPVQNTVPEYENKPALPNKWLNPDGSYSTFTELIGGSIDTELFVVVKELPSTGEPNKIYLLIREDGTCVEYVWVNSKWDPIGMVEFDLSKYSTTEQMNQAITNAVTSSDNYTDTQIQEKITQVLGGRY